MRQRFFFGLLGLVLPAAVAGGAALAGCGETVVVSPPPRGTGGHDAGLATGGGSGGGPSDLDAQPDYADPGCADAGPPLTQFHCDPYNQHNGDCPPGDGCYIYTQNPQTPCGQEIYGASCEAVGQGQQGAPCMGAQQCGAGLACVVTGSGNQCVVLCELQGSAMCPPGLVCEPVDVQGFGGCL